MIPTSVGNEIPIVEDPDFIGDERMSNSECRNDRIQFGDPLRRYSSPIRSGSSTLEDSCIFRH